LSSRWQCPSQMSNLVPPGWQPTPFGICHCSQPPTNNRSKQISWCCLKCHLSRVLMITMMFHSVAPVRYLPRPVFLSVNHSPRICCFITGICVFSCDPASGERGGGEWTGPAGDQRGREPQRPRRQASQPRPEPQHRSDGRSLSAHPRKGSRPPFRSPRAHTRPHREGGGGRLMVAFGCACEARAS